MALLTSQLRKHPRTQMPYITKRREQAVLYSYIGSVRIAKHPVRDRVEQAAILRCRT